MQVFPHKTDIQETSGTQRGAASRGPETPRDTNTKKDEAPPSTTPDFLLDGGEGRGGERMARPPKGSFALGSYQAGRARLGIKASIQPRHFPAFVLLLITGGLLS